MNELTISVKIDKILEDYTTQYNSLEKSLQEFENHCTNLQSKATLYGTFGNTHLDFGRVYIKDLKDSLLKSSWQYMYQKLNIETIAPATDKAMFRRALENPPEFTYENITATFEDYWQNPFENILRGLAEVFTKLDPAYKSHEKVKIGVKGLPKRVILSSVNSYGWGRESVMDILNALAAYQGKPMASYQDVSELLKDSEYLKDSRGIWLKRYKNGNAHMYFDTETLRDINKALHQYYGDVLADCHTETEHKQTSSAVAKDLQYYATPVKIVDKILENVYFQDGDHVLEPSCGCGRFLDGMKRLNKSLNVLGIEYDAGRVSEARAKGHTVIIDNFLDIPPKEAYDKIIMNPPFYGKHYEKHIRHALKFLKDEGTLVAVLPSTARYDHNLLSDLDKGYNTWTDLPCGSFRESGTNIAISVFTYKKSH